MSGTSDTNGGQTATNTADTGDFDAITKAVLEGNHAELDRLMAVKDESTKETEEEVEETVEAVEESKEEEVVEENKDDGTKEGEPSKGETSEQDPEKNEAASSAASSVKSNEDVEAIKRELHQYKSDAGRVPYLQRRMAELERELRAYKARESTQTTQANGKVDSSKAELDPELQQEIDELREIDPVLAKTLERVAKTAVATAQQKVESAVTTITQQEQEAEDYRFYTEQKARLLNMIPQAEQVFALPEWKAWKESLTPARRAMAESGYADEVAIAIQAFAADMQHRQGGVRQAAPVQTTTQAQVVDTPETNTVVAQTRQRKVEVVDASKASTAAKKAETFDIDQAFREMYQQVAKQNHIL